MTLKDKLIEIGDVLAPYLTKELLLDIWDIAKIVLIVIAILLVIRFIIRLKFFKRIKLILRNVIEINNKMGKLVELLDDQIIVVDEKNNKKKITPLIKKFLKKQK